MNIKEIREHYGLTQNQLANITGIPARTIGNWETGTRQPADYMPDLIVAMIEQKKEDNMGAFDLGLAKCRAKQHEIPSYCICESRVTVSERICNRSLYHGNTERNILARCC